MSNKQKELSLEQKREMIMFKKTHSLMKDIQIQKHFENKFNRRIPKGTMSGFINNEKLLEVDTSNTFR